MIEVDRTGAGAKYDARCRERAGCNRRLTNGSAPMFSVPFDPAFNAIVTGPATTPLSAIVSLPVPEEPIVMAPPTSQVDVGPVTVTVPVEPADSPTTAPKELITLPPSSILRTPVPCRPTKRRAFDHVEPVPVTVTVPFEPGPPPMNPPPNGAVVNVPPPWIVSAPTPSTPTDT